MGNTRDSTPKIVAHRAVDALGSGFDVTKDYRLEFCKGPVVQLGQAHTNKLAIPGGIVVRSVPKDVTCDKGEQMRFTSEVMQFQQDLSIIPRRRGGITSSKSHVEWQGTVSSCPDAISMSFVPITSLISGISGGGFLQHAINLYIRYKLQLEDLKYFLDFQVPRQWIPVYNELPLRLLRIQAFSPSLQFSLMGPKLYINTAELVVPQMPVTGIRLYLEGRSSNRLAVHLQHLSVLPRILEHIWGDGAKVEEPRWHGSTKAEKNWFEPVQWKNFSHVCTQPIEYQSEWQDGKHSAFVVMGARLEVTSHGLKHVLHLSLLFTKLSGCTIQKSQWDQTPTLHKSSFFSTLSTTFSSTTKAPAKKANSPVVTDSSVFPGHPPKPAQSLKLLRFVDTTELSRGPQDIPGHWVITAGKLEVENGKICLRIQYSLLNYC